MSELQLASYRSVLSQCDPSKDLDCKSSEEITTTSGKLANLNSNNILMQLRKICNHPYLTLEDCRSIPDELYYRYVTSASGKLAVLSTLLDFLIPSGHKVLIFCQFTTMLDILEGYLHMNGYPCYRLDGTTNRDTRDHIIKEFHRNSQSSPTVDDDFGDSESDESTEKSGEDEIVEQKKAEIASIFLLSTRAG